MYNILSLEEYHMKPALLERIWTFSRNETPPEPYIKKLVTWIKAFVSGSLENEHQLLDSQNLIILKNAGDLSKSRNFSTGKTVSLFQSSAKSKRVLEGYDLRFPHVRFVF